MVKVTSPQLSMQSAQAFNGVSGSAVSMGYLQTCPCTPLDEIRSRHDVQIRRYKTPALDSLAFAGVCLRLSAGNF